MGGKEEGESGGEWIEEGKGGQRRGRLNVEFYHLLLSN